MPGFILSNLCTLINSVFLETRVNFQLRGCFKMTEIALIVQRKETCTYLIQKCEEVNLPSKGKRSEGARNERKNFWKKTKSISMKTVINAQTTSFYPNSFPGGSWPFMLGFSLSFMQVIYFNLQAYQTCWKEIKEEFLSFIILKWIELCYY